MFEAGQRVKVLVDKAYSTETGMLGRVGTVLDNASSSDVVTYVKLDGANTDERAVFGKRMACEVFSNNQLKVVEAKPAKAKSKKISIDEVQVGDEIVAFRNSSGVETRRKGVVGKIVEGVARTRGDNILTHFYNSAGGIYPAHHIYLLNRPEPKKPEIEDGVYYVTSTMAGIGPWQVTVANEVAVWKYGKDWQYQAYGSYKGLVEAKSGEYSDMKFHTEDPTPKGFDALDKTKTYILKHKRATDYPLDWYLAFKDGIWKYGHKNDISTAAGGFEKHFTEATSSWEKPVEWVEPELTVEDLVGKKYRLEDELDYKVTAKGNLKVRWSDRTVHTDGWHNSVYDLEDVLGWIKSGEAVEI